MTNLTTTTVAEVLARSARAVRVFLDHRMACVGCTMAPYDTVADAADAYGIDASSLADELGDAIRSDPGGANDTANLPTDRPTGGLKASP